MSTDFHVRTVPTILTPREHVLLQRLRTVLHDSKLVDADDVGTLQLISSRIHMHLHGSMDCAERSPRQCRGMERLVKSAVHAIILDECYRFQFIPCGVHIYFNEEEGEDGGGPDHILPPTPPRDQTVFQYPGIVSLSRL